MRHLVCPLCGAEPIGRSWRASTFFAGQLFEYVRCRSCGSEFCSPMPDEKTLKTMYGLDYYAEREPEGGEIEATHDRAWVGGWLQRGRPSSGPFIDYGCGDGELLAAASRAGWDVAGVEFNDEVVQHAARTTGQRVFRVGEEGLSRLAGQGAILHLGDVVEHLTDPQRQLGEILRLLRPDGILLAQGPLESQPNLFNAFLRAKRAVSSNTPTTVPPYHVLLATAAGQLALFNRLQLRAIEFVVSEVDWPAPSRFVPRMMREPRSLLLFMTRRLSRRVSRLAPARLGNRYCYAGSRAASA